MTLQDAMYNNLLDALAQADAATADAMDAAGARLVQVSTRSLEPLIPAGTIALSALRADDPDLAVVMVPRGGQAIGSVVPRVRLTVL